MENNTKKIILKIVCAVLLATAVVFNAIAIKSAVSFQKAQLIINICACLFAIIYTTFGFKKNARLFYKLFVGFIALKEACALINMAVYESIEWYAFALILICYTCPLILLLRQDLGKKCSIIVVSVYLLVAIISFAAGVAIMSLANADGQALAIYNGTRILIALLFFALIFGKYIDKAERNSK